MRTKSLFSGFLTKTNGNFAMITAIAVPAIFGAVGLGINASQLYHAKSNLRQALDAAITSTARDLTTGVITEDKAKETVEKVLQANVGNGFAVDALFTIEQLNVDKLTNTVSAVAATDVDVSFPLFGMGKRHRVVTEAAAVYSDRKIEIAFMLDLTGSMGDKGSPKNGVRQSKLQNLQDAARDAVENLLDRNANPTDPRLRVALVPYSQGVRLGALSDAIWYEGADVEDEPQSIGWLNDPANEAIKAKLDAAKAAAGDSCTTERKKRQGSGFVLDTSDDGPGGAMINRDDRLSARDCVASEIVPLTADRGKLISAINRFDARGTTAGHIGIQWTQYILSPKWGDFLTDKGFSKSVPRDYADPKAKKIAILMTDGEFNTAYVDVSNPNMSNEAQQKSPQYAEALCAEMKSNNIEVFTIGFMLNQQKAKLTMANCASPDTDGVAHFYDAANGDQLKAAFNSITANIERVALVN